MFTTTLTKRILKYGQLKKKMLKPGRGDGVLEEDLDCLWLVSVHG